MCICMVAGAAQSGSDPAQPAKSTGEAIEGVSDGPSASFATGTRDADRGLSSAPQNRHAGLQLASRPPNPGPPTPGMPETQVDACLKL